MNQDTLKSVMSQKEDKQMTGLLQRADYGWWLEYEGEWFFFKTLEQVMEFLGR